MHNHPREHAHEKKIGCREDQRRRRHEEKKIERMSGDCRCQYTLHRPSRPTRTHSFNVTEDPDEFLPSPPPSPPSLIHELIASPDRAAKPSSWTRPISSRPR